MASTGVPKRSKSSTASLSRRRGAHQCPAPRRWRKDGRAQWPVSHRDRHPEYRPRSPQRAVRPRCSAPGRRSPRQADCPRTRSPGITGLRPTGKTLRQEPGRVLRLPAHDGEHPAGREGPGAWSCRVCIRRGLECLTKPALSFIQVAAVVPEEGQGPYQAEERVVVTGVPIEVRNVRRLSRTGLDSPRPGDGWMSAASY
jgi:hypothetical protein